LSSSGYYLRNLGNNNKILEVIFSLLIRMVACGIDSDFEDENLMNNWDVSVKENPVKLKSKLNQDGCTDHKCI